MLFEIGGKVYEINDTFLYVLGGIALVCILGLGVWGISGLVTQIPLIAEPSPVGVDAEQNIGTQSAFTPKEVEEVLEDNPKAGAEELCHFNGRGRLAGKIANKFDCRSTESLKILTIEASTIYCCVAP